MNRILVVDDDEAIRMLYAEELSEEGYEVITNDGDSQIMTMIKEKKPDVIVMDIRLGQQDGLDLLQDIRNRYYNLPVILCTAYANFKYDLKSIAADYYVVKNSNLSELKTKIKMAIEGCKDPSYKATDDNTLPKGKIPSNQISFYWKETP